MLAYELTRWWAYRRITAPSMVHYLWTAPLLVTLVATSGYLLLPIKPPLSGQGSLLGSATQLLALVPGFFITALAAVSTFNRPEMDETMPKPSPLAKIQHRGNWVPIELTRRMFLAYLFSYLAVLSVILFAVSVAAPAVYPSVALLSNVDTPVISGEYLVTILKTAFFVTFTYFLSSIFVTTLHGVYFLCERMLMPTT